MQPVRRAPTIRSKMTLGALYHCLIDRLDTSLGLRVGIHFEERTSVVVEGGAAGTEPQRIEQRTFDADLVVRAHQVVTATLTARATGAETLVVRIAQSGAGSRYSIAGEGFGEVRETPDLFDLRGFGEKLDGIPVDDAVIDQENPDGSGRIVVDAEIDGDGFVKLLRVFAGSASEDPELPLLSHSAVLSAGPDVSLDYWWSLLGLDEVEGRHARHNVVVCHVQASFAPLNLGDADEAPITDEPGLPVLEDLDAVWELARRRRG